MIRYFSQRKRGFTLIELLVVVGIIAVLIAILIPSISFARRLAGRTSNSANLSGLFKSANLFANDKGFWPGVNTSEGRINDGSVPRSGAAGTTFDGQIGRDYATATKSNTTQVSNTRAMYTLLKLGGGAAKSFINPLTSDEPDIISDFSLYYDFTDGTRVSYGYQSIFYTNEQPNENREGSAVAFADRGPVYRGATSGTGVQSQLSVDGGKYESSASAVSDITNSKVNRRTLDEVSNDVKRSLNSRADQGEGQGIVRHDGGAAFEKDPWQGKGRDNMYTVAQGSNDDTRSVQGTFGAGKQPVLSAQDASKNSGDSFIIP